MIGETTVTVQVGNAIAVSRLLTSLRQVIEVKHADLESGGKLTFIRHTMSETDNMEVTVPMPRTRCNGGRLIGMYVIFITCT